MRVSDFVVSLLDRVECKGNTLSLAPLGQLERKAYTDLDKVLREAGGKWNRGQRVHLFDADAAEIVERLILTREVTSSRVAFQQFDTPPELAQTVADLAGIMPGMDVLEPSAGLGALVIAARKAGGTVFAYEIDPKRFETLRGQYAVAGRPFSAVCGDFLSAEPSPFNAGLFDAVVMNPPFTKGQDIAHVTHALKFRRPGAALVSIMSGSVPSRQTKAHVAFRELIDGLGGTFLALPEDSFKSAGTAVSTCLCVVPKSRA